MPGIQLKLPSTKKKKRLSIRKKKINQKNHLKMTKMEKNIKIVINIFHIFKK